MALLFCHDGGISHLSHLIGRQQQKNGTSIIIFSNNAYLFSRAVS